MENLDLYIMSGLYIFAGCMHFVTPKMFKRIVPPYIPYRMAMVYVSGLFEVLFGTGLIFDETRSWSALGLILLLIAVFPANIYMAKRFREKGHKYTWATYARLPLQFLLINWAYLYW